MNFNHVKFRKSLMCVFERYMYVKLMKITLSTHLHVSLASLFWDIGKQNRPRWDAAFCGVESGAIPFALRIFIQKLNKI